MRVAAVNASAGGQPVVATRVRTQSVEPDAAARQGEAVGGEPDSACRTRTSRSPSTVGPSGRSSAAVVSLTRTNRAGPNTSQVARTTAGCRCRPSTMTPARRSGGSPPKPPRTAPTSPGSRWPSGGIALYRWVTARAPAATAAWPARTWPRCGRSRRRHRGRSGRRRHRARRGVRAPPSRRRRPPPGSTRRRDRGRERAGGRRDGRRDEQATGRAPRRGLLPRAREWYAFG